MTIQTKYLGATNTRGARIKAGCEVLSITHPYDYALDGFDNHKAVARELARELKWPGHYYAGDLGNGYIFVRVTNGSSSFAVYSEESQALYAEFEHPAA